MRYRETKSAYKKRTQSAGYDLIDDFDLIVSSMMSEYGVRIYSEKFKKMKWGEFAGRHAPAGNTRTKSIGNAH